ncbi:hypothetical protein N0V82_001987 [Gnomoniopsis sp. IMI 355080]|nr:hypothetical protein N0V82_001987 [Gnomoniopsis sp. IMI 355080]
MANHTSLRFEDAFRKQTQGKASTNQNTQLKPQISSNSRRQILVAVDFDKVPTGNFKWGFNFDETEDRFQWFKLEQDPKYKRQDLKNAYPPQTVQPENEEQVRVLITEYLKNFREHVEKSIRDSLDYGDGLQNVLLKDIHWEYIITVPALWPESAQNITKACAEAAGMTPLQIIAEPEAAGIYALDHMNHELDMKVGDTFVICDAGGGTVDLISYTVTKLEPGLYIPRMELEEAAAGTGGLCGSSFLDREFFRWLTAHVQDCRHWSQNHTSDAMIKWETETKRNFTGGSSSDKKYLIPARRIDDDRTLNIRKDNLEVSATRMKKIFEPVVSQIVGLVRGQLNEVQKSGKTVNAVLLAGGFGRNEYLRKGIQREVGSGVKVKKMKDWKPGGVDGGERIDVMHWFNSRVKDFQDQEFDFYYDQTVRNAEYNGRLDTITLAIYICELDKAPDYPDSAQAGPKTPACKKLVDLKANLDKIPRQRLKVEQGEDGQMYYKIDFKIVMTCHLANVMFKLVHDGEQYGKVDAVWDTT